MVVKPLVPGIPIPFLNQLIVGEEPPLLAARLIITVSFAHIVISGDEILILCIRFVFAVIKPFTVFVLDPPGFVTVSETAKLPGLL